MSFADQIFVEACIIVVCAVVGLAAFAIILWAFVTDWIARFRDWRYWRKRAVRPNNFGRDFK